MFLLIFLSCPFHFTLLSLQFPSLFASNLSIFLVCPVIKNFRTCSFHILYIVLFFHFPPCPFLLFQFFTSSNVLLSSFHFTLLYFNASRFLPLSFHVLYLPCPSIVWSYPFIVPPCHVQNLTDRIFGMHDPGHHGGHNLYA